MNETNGALTNVRYLRGCHNREDAVKMRDGIMSYVNGVGEVEWQMVHVIPDWFCNEKSV